MAKERRAEKTRKRVQRAEKGREEAGKDEGTEKPWGPDSDFLAKEVVSWEVAFLSTPTLHPSEPITTLSPSPEARQGLPVKACCV